LERAIFHDADDPQKRTVDPADNPLPTFALERLRSHRREQKDRFDALGLCRINDSLVFDRESNPWCPNTFGLWFARLAKRFELSRVRLQDLRHSYASLMVESGVDLKTVSTALGHSTIRVTADTYTHVSPAMLQSAAAKRSSVATRRRL
jgi:integrase